jgi:RNA polymerase sigma factor (sigma-70 family)
LGWCRPDLSIDPAFEDLYRDEFPNVFRAAYVLSGNRAVAEDAAQEAFARALERWNRLSEVPWVRGWITTTALNAARRSLRRRREPAPDAAAGVDLDEWIDLWRGVRGLPRRQQEAVLLHYAADLPLSEVAGAMKCEEGTVKAHLARAREALRRQREGALDE